MNYEALVGIDITNLEEEFIKHSKAYYLVVTKHAEISRDLDHLAEKIKVLGATLGRDAKNGASSTSKKMTMADIDNLISCNEDIIQMNNDKIDMQYKVNLLQGVLKSLEHKRDMLKLLGWQQNRNDSM